MNTLIGWVAVALLATGKRVRQSPVLKRKLKTKPDALVLGLGLFFSTLESLT